MLNFTSFLLKYFFSLFLILYTTTALSAPSGSITFSGETPTKGSLITVTGSGFGTKSIASPVIYDFSDKAYIKGTLDIKQGSLNEGDPLLPGDSRIYWSKPSSTAGGSSNVRITYDQDHRNTNVTAHYTFDGFNGFVGWPYAYGGKTTKDNNKKLYVSWWYKPFFNPRFYWRWDLRDVKGKFITGSNPYQPGERIIINSPALGNIHGQVIWQDNNQLHFIAMKATSSSHLRGAFIEGVTSRATALLPDDNTAYLPPGSNKFIRIWEESTGKTAFTQAWTQMNTTIRKPDGKNIVSETDTSLKVGRWNHLEVEVDLLNNTYREWLNNKLHKNIDITPSLRDDTTFSPTIALLGFNGKEQQYQRTEFGEIYMDNSLQRIVVTNAADLSKVTRSEIQLPKTWSDGNITFELNPGHFKTGDDSSLYIFVYDKNGVANSTGIQLCSPCTAPPNTGLNIQKK